MLQYRPPKGWAGFIDYLGHDATAEAVRNSSSPFWCLILLNSVCLGLLLMLACPLLLLPLLRGGWSSGGREGWVEQGEV